MATVDVSIAPTYSTPDGCNPCRGLTYSAAVPATNNSNHSAALRGGTFLFSDPPTIVGDSFAQRDTTGPPPPPFPLLGGVPNGVAPPRATHDPNLPRHDPSSTAWPPPRRESLSVKSPAPWVLPPGSHSDAMETINIAAIGAEGVGKSHFIQRALHLSRPPTANVNGIRMDVDGIPHIVTLIELDLEYFDVDPVKPIAWPKQINGHMVPRIDAALILYDVMNKESIRDLPPAVSALGNSGLPTILVATKCDNPETSRQLNPEGMAQLFPSVVDNFKTSSNVSTNTKDCLQAIVRAAISNRGGDKAEAAARRRATSSAAHSDTPLLDSIGGRPMSGNSSKHSRASSDLSLLRGHPQISTTDSFYRGQNARSPRVEFPNSPLLTSSTFGGDATDDGPSQTVSSMLRTPGVRLEFGQDTFFDDESESESYRYSDDIPILQRSDDSFLDKPKVTGVAFDDLVDRLLAPRMTRADSNFAEIFLCLYRQIAAPSELFSAIATRLDRNKDDKTTHYLAKTTTQLRIIEVVAKWATSYPGDFARPPTRIMLEDLIVRLSAEPIFSLAAQQMQNQLELYVVEDDDTGWARSDEVDEETARVIRQGGRETSELSEAMRSFQMDDARSSERPLSSAFDALGSDAENSNIPGQYQFHSFEDYAREAAILVPTAQLPLNKIRYRIFMEQDPEDVADEITRIDWVMFSSIRIRDLVRHVSLPLEQKERCRSLKNVNRMISHFNHLAKWVSNMVLVRDKAKHRGPCLQKFMQIALRLRQLNNYNGLAAVLAGINGTAVHRLAQTRALVDADTQRRFARLVLLMGTQKSHFAYRLAWENSPLPRIPFMPLHRRDLVSAEEGSRTFVGPNGDRINWKKFEVLGEVLLPIMKSQGTPYPNLKQHNDLRELILGCRMPTDDEEIYQRSIQVEPAGPAESSKKKFPWRAK